MPNRSERARQHRQRAVQMVQQIRRAEQLILNRGGTTTATATAAALNEMGVKTVRGLAWTHHSVQRFRGKWQALLQEYPGAAET